MLENKRERKPPNRFVPETIVKPDKDKLLEKKRRLEGDTYETIPFPTKYNDTDDVFVLYGNFAFKQHEMEIYSDFSLLNTFYLFPHIEINQTKNQKLLTIKSEKRSSVRFHRWSTVVNQLNDTKKPNLRVYANHMKEYCAIFQKLITKHIKRTDKALKTEERESMLTEFSNSRAKSKERLLKYPSIQFKSHFTGHRDRLVEVVVNERLLLILGYDIDTFVSNVMREGIPSILAFSSQNSESLIQNILRDLACRKIIEYQSPELACHLMTKSGYLRRSQIQIDIQVNYDNGRYGINTTLVVLDENFPPSFMLENLIEFDYNQDFIQLMCNQEEETAYFFETFYKSSIYKKYTYMNQICRIKEL